MDEAVWHYARNGARHGPITGRKIEQLVTERVVTKDTPVWRQGMAEWIPLVITPLGEGIFGHPGDLPPPLPKAHISNSLAWILATAPLWTFLVADLILSSMYYGDPERSAYEMEALLNNGGFWIACWIINGVLCMWDSGRLQRAGHDAASGAWGWLLVPIYLYRRARSLRQPQHCFIGWCACFVLSLFY